MFSYPLVFVSPKGPFYIQTDKLCRADTKIVSEDLKFFVFLFSLDFNRRKWPIVSWLHNIIFSSFSPLRSWGNLLLDVFPSMLFDTMQSDISLRQGMPRRHLLVRILHHEKTQFWLLKWDFAVMNLRYRYMSIGLSLNTSILSSGTFIAKRHLTSEPV